MLSLLTFIIVCIIQGTYSLDCRTIEKDHHFTSTIPYYGFKNELVISTRIQFNTNTAHYLFPPTDNKGRECSQSWNQLWGATRCGYITNNHQDSDRFMWRRAGSCLIYDSTGHVIGEKPNCLEANLIELAASGYDDGLKPYEHPGVLQKPFSTKAQIETWYKLTITFEKAKTTYQLFDDTNVLLETQIINHRSCTGFNRGMMQGFYFGGDCPAPQPITVCYG